MIVIDQTGRVAAGTTTNGANHKIPGYCQYEIEESSWEDICFPAPFQFHYRCVIPITHSTE